MEELLFNFIFIGKGLFITLKLLIASIIVGGLIGLFFSILYYKNIAKLFIKFYISILRGTPLILQLSLVYFALPGLIGIKLDIIGSGVVALGLNSSAYIAEVLRGGIESIPKGQFEAVQTLRISSYAMWKDIILPQVARNILPAMTNEVIALLKETALISIIGGMDIMRSAQVVAAQQFTYFLPLCIAAAYYYILVLLIAWGGKLIEQRVSYVKN